MNRMKNKTYRNFCIVMNKLIAEKGYETEDAKKLTHLVFENFEFDKDYGHRPVSFFYDLILPASEFRS